MSRGRELFADLDGLARVAAALDEAHRTLAMIDRRSSAGAGAAEFGDAHLADVHGTFLAQWRGARVECSEGLDACSSYVHGAVATYRDADDTVLTAVRRP